MNPPPFAVYVTFYLHAGWSYVLLHIFKGSLIEGRLVFRHFHAEVDDPHPSGTATYITAVDPRADHVAIWTPVWVDWFLQHGLRRRVVNVKQAALCIAHEG